MNIPAVILWNLAPCSRLTKCHQLGQWRAYFGLTFLIEVVSLYLTKCIQSAGVPNSSVSLRWIQKGERAQETQEPVHLKKTQMQRFQIWGAKRDWSPKARLGMLLASHPHPHHRPQKSSMEEATEKGLTGVSLVQADSYACLTMKGVTLRQYNCTSITSTGNGNFEVIPP